MRKIEHKIIDNVECKWCSKCKNWKELGLFNARLKNHDGIKEWCKSCCETHTRCGGKDLHCGVYALMNKVNGKMYIGGSTFLVERYATHISKLKNGIHPNYKLQEDWDKYSEEDFVFEVIEYCDNKNLSKNEVANMRKVSRDCIYNVYSV